MPVCTNCGGPARSYCAECGQRQLTPGDLTLAAFAKDSFHEFTSVDGRLWNTLITLIRHPGQLTRDYFDGRGARYMKPLNLFLLLNLVFFLVQPHTGLMQFHLDMYMNKYGAAALDKVNAYRVDQALSDEAQRERYGMKPRPARVMSPEVFATRFESTLQDLKKSMLIVAIPFLAVAVAIVFPFQRHRFAEHLVFSSHIWAFFLVFMTLVTPFFDVVMPLLRFFGLSRGAQEFMASETALIAVLFIGIGTYLYFALRRMHPEARLAAAARAVALFFAIELFIGAFSSGLFAVTLWSL